MSEEYKPGFKAWLFSIFLAAGFGSLLADGIRYLVIQSQTKEAQLEWRDKQCRKEGNRTICNFYFENTGDELQYITDVIVDGEDHSTFFTNAPIEVFAADVNTPIKRAHVAIAEPGKMVMIGIAVMNATKAPVNICLKSGEKELCCIKND